MVRRQVADTCDVATRNHARLAISEGFLSAGVQRCNGKHSGGVLVEQTRSESWFHSILYFMKTLCKVCAIHEFKATVL